MDKNQMDKIMQERIHSFNEFVMAQDIEKLPLGLFNGKMGLCIYFYHQARLTQNKKYEKFAEKLLDLIYSQTHNEMPVDMENGLAGICVGINYLIKEQFVSGNVNFILKELDDKIFRSLNFIHLSNNSNLQIENLTIILGVLYYFSIRLENNRLAENERYLFKNIIIKAINEIEKANVLDKYTEPYLFSSTNYFLPIYLIFLSRIYKQKFYNYKLEKIFDEISDKLKTTYPLLQCNRLFLNAGIKCINEVKAMDGWKNHIDLLENNINISTIIKEEFRNNNILPNNGISGFYCILNNFNKVSSIHKNLIAEKIAFSDLWNLLDEDDENKIPLGLVSGFSGIILTYQNTLTKNDDEN